MSSVENPESPFGEIQHPKKRAYLRALVEVGGNVTRACEVAEIDRSTPYSDPWVQDEGFQRALRLAEAMAADHLEAEAIRRAYEGVREPVGFYKGEPSAYVQKYSDTLLIFLLKGSKPNRYADRHQLSGPDGGPIQYEELSDAELKERTRQLANRLPALSSTNGKND